MGFLKRGKVPHELPDLALDNSVRVSPKEAIDPIVENVLAVSLSSSEAPKKEVAGEDYLEFPSVPEVKEIEKQVSETFGGNSSHAGFFDGILNDINGGIQDLGNLEDWYKNKFLPQDAVSDMRGYWEGNKTDIIIQSFGAEYKEKITAKVKLLQELEGDWREIYFKLIKKEEEMKKEELEMKNTLSEFVDLCKRRKVNGEEAG